MRALGEGCQENNLSLNIIKTKELIVDFRKQQREHPAIHMFVYMDFNNVVCFSPNTTFH